MGAPEVPPLGAMGGARRRRGRPGSDVVPENFFDMEEINRLRKQSALRCSSELQSILDMWWKCAIRSQRILLEGTLPAPESWRGTDKVRLLHVSMTGKPVEDQPADKAGKAKQLSPRKAKVTAAPNPVAKPNDASLAGLSYLGYELMLSKIYDCIMPSKQRTAEAAARALLAREQAI